MNSFEKYNVTLRCVPEEGCNSPQNPEGCACVRFYPVLACSRQEAVERAFALHAQNCDQACGNCEITTETELVSQDLID